MKLGRKYRPHFSGRGLGFLFGIVLAMALLLIPMRDANSSVIKMPKPLPDIIKNYKSVKVWAGSVGMNHTGLKVNRGDYITILAKGTINVWPAKGKEYAYGPKALLLFQLGDNDYPVGRYKGPELMETEKDGGIYLGYRGSEMSQYGRPLKPGNYADDIGSFYVDIIIWKTNDPKPMIKFLEEASLAQPKDLDLKEIAQEFKWRQEGYLALQKKTTEVEEIKKELSIVETKKISETKKEEKKAGIPPKEKEAQRIKDNDKETATKELSERLQKALQALKELEDTKKKLSEREEKEAQLLARLESMERERSRQPKNLPLIAIGYPKDGMSVDSEYVPFMAWRSMKRGFRDLRFWLTANQLV